MKISRSLLPALLSLLIYSFANAQFAVDANPSQTGNQPYASCLSCSGAVWDNTTNISSLDGSYSSTQLQPLLTCFESWCFKSRYLTTSNYGFSIPSYAIITGISVNETGHCSIANAVQDSTVKLCKIINVMTGSNHAINNYWPITDTTKVYGSEHDLWGTTWLPQDINSPDFGVWMKVMNSSCQSSILYVDAVSITVYYSIGTTVYSQTQTSQSLRVINDEVNELLYIEMDDPGINSSLHIIDVSGRSIYSSALTGPVIQISTSLFEKGIYFISVYGDNKRYSTKTIIN